MSRDDNHSRRWVMLALTSMALLLFYGDRQVLSFLKTTIGAEYNWTGADYSMLVTAFMLPYTLMYLVSGRLADRLGPRVVGAAALIGMSLAGLSFVLAHQMWQFVGARCLLGVAESAVMPVTTLVLAAYFRPEKRGFAFGLRGQIYSIAVIFTPPALIGLAANYGWRLAFLVPALVGFVVAVVWWLLLHGGAHTVASPTEKATSAVSIIRRTPVLRRLLIARVVSDPFWFFFSYWQAPFLQEHFGVDLHLLQRIAWIPPAFDALALVLVGLFSDRWIAKGQSAANARLLTLRAVTLLAPAAILLPLVPFVSVAVAILALLQLMCDVWLTFSTVLIADVAPKQQVASVLAVIAFCSGITSLLFNAVSGPIVDRFGYAPCFIVGAFLHPIAALIIRPTRTEAAPELAASTGAISR